jgi:hypothetical protein
MLERILPGMKVQICEGSGLDSGKIGKVMYPSELKCDGRGVPQLPGHYSPINFRKEAAIRLEDGSVTTMYLNRLIRLG